jgi:hypothetical protein
MREDCRHFESRTYDDGEVARLCVLDLAPEAPWRCPESCPQYEPSLIDGTFQVGSLVRPPVEEEPDEAPDAIGDLLDDAERIVDEAEPEVLREVQAEAPGGRRWWRRRPRRPPDEGDDFRLSNR